MTTKLNSVVLLRGMPFTMMGYVPAGVASVVVMVKVLLQVGEHGLFVGAAMASAGRPPTEVREISLEEYAVIRVRIIVLLPDCPWLTVMSPLFERL